MRRDRRYDEIKRCLAQAEQAFALADAAEDDAAARSRLIEEAEAWLVRAENRLARLTDRSPFALQPDRIAPEHRSFGDLPPDHERLIWRREPKS